MAVPIHGDPRLRVRWCRCFAVAMEDGTTHCAKQVLKASTIGSCRRVLNDRFTSPLHSWLDEYVFPDQGDFAYLTDALPFYI